MKKKSEREPLVLEYSERPSWPTFMKILFTLSIVVIIVLSVIVGLLATGILTSRKPPVSSCSGRGVFYADIQMCQCNDCYHGANCETLMADENCTVDAGAGNPYLHQEYWIKSKLEDYSTAHDYRCSYEWSLVNPMPASLTTGIHGLLNQRIRQLHQKYGNFDTTDSYLILGSGGTSMISAILSAYSTTMNNEFQLYSRAPYYSGYQYGCVLGQSCTWTNDTSNVNSTFVEIVTSPSNPEGTIRTQVTNSNNVFHDLVYYWPHQLPRGYNMTKVQASIAIFSLSKLTGNAASRFGWAFVKDLTFATHMSTYVAWNYYHISVDAAYRALHVLDYLLSSGGDDFMSHIRQHYVDRANRLVAIFAGNANFEIVSELDTFYLFVHCKTMSATTCVAYLRSYGIVCFSGDGFGAAGHVRMSLAMASSSFDLLIAKLERAIKGPAKFTATAVSEEKSSFLKNPREVV